MIHRIVLVFLFCVATLCLSSPYETGLYIAGGAAAMSGIAAAGAGIYSGSLAQTLKKKKRMGQLRQATHVSNRIKRAHQIAASFGVGAIVSAALSVVLYKKYYAVRQQEEAASRDAHARLREEEETRLRKEEVVRLREEEEARRREEEEQADLVRQEEVKQRDVALQVTKSISRASAKLRQVTVSPKIAGHLSDVFVMLGKINENSSITKAINAVRRASWSRQKVHQTSRACSGDTPCVRERDGRIYSVLVDGKEVRLKHKVVENYQDRTCIGHSMALAVLGYPYQGASIALCLALNAPRSNDLSGLLETIQGTQAMEFNWTLQALADWSGRPVYVWQWGADAFPTTGGLVDGCIQTASLCPYFDPFYDKMIPSHGLSLSAEDAIHLFYVIWPSGGAHCEVLMQEKFWEPHNLAALNLVVFQEAFKAFGPLLSEHVKYLVAGSLSLRQYIEVYIQSLACAHGIDQQENIGNYLKKIESLSCDSCDAFRTLQDTIKDTIFFIIASLEKLYQTQLGWAGEIEKKLALFKSGLLWEGSSKSYKWLTLLTDVDYKQACLAYIWKKSLESMTTRAAEDISVARYYYDSSGVVYRYGSYVGKCTAKLPLFALLYRGTASKKLSFVSSGGHAVIPGTGSEIYMIASGAGAGSGGGEQTSNLCPASLQEDLVKESEMRDFFALLAATTNIAIVVHELRDSASDYLHSAWWGDRKNKSINILKEGDSFIHLWDCLNGYRLLTQDYVDAQTYIDDWYEQQHKVTVVNNKDSPLCRGVLLHGRTLVSSAACWPTNTQDGSRHFLNGERLWFLIKDNSGYSLLAILVKDLPWYRQAYPDFDSENASFVIRSAIEHSKGIMASDDGRKYYLGRFVAVIPALAEEAFILPKGLLRTESYINAEQLAVILGAVKNESLRAALTTYFGGGDFSNGAAEEL